MYCVRTVSYSLLHNGEVSSDIISRRGVRQGDPISPYLYILCVEGLSAIIRRNEEVDLIHECIIAREVPTIYYLLFVDDCYFFFHASEVEAGNMKSILKMYEMIYGQAINYNKSNVIFISNTTMKDRRRVCTSLEV